LARGPGVPCLGTAQTPPNAFFNCAQADFEAAAAALAKQIPSLTDAQINLRLMMLTAMLGDSHTQVGIATPFHQFPIAAYWFADGLVIVGASDQQRDLIGAKVLRIGELRAEAACRRAAAAFPYENEATLRNLSPRYAMMGEVAHAFGIITDAGRMPVTIQPSAGPERSVVLSWLRPGERISWPQIDNTRLPLYRQARGTANWMEWLPDEKAVYFRYGRCGDETGQAVAAIVEKVSEAIDANSAERLIVDLRNNGGGNSALLAPFIFDLKERPIGRRPGAVIVLIGRGTFSSAELNAMNFKNAVNAVLIGEPTGQKPNAYGEIKTFKLPHSRLSVQYSTKFFKTEDGDRESMDPDIRIDLSSADFFACKDPVLDAALKYQPK
jgi:hypothetical protein